jgi:glyoxylase-like metal-dependent hydrolase (beta-lactamase superfamily II)
MKSLHRTDLYSWSSFDRERNIDFNSIAWIRPDGNVLVDPLPLSSHDREHLNLLGGAAWIVVTNSDHIRASEEIAGFTGAKIAGPAGERETFPLACQRWLSEGDELVPGLKVLVIEGSKTPGELALLLEGNTLITGDLIRANWAGSLTILPYTKLENRSKAVASVRRLAEIEEIQVVLLGDGWSVFRDGSKLLQELVDTL